MVETETDLEAELREITALSRKPEETDDHWLTRIVRSVDKLAESQWDNLSNGAQNWANKASKALDAKQSIPRLPGMKPAPAAEPAQAVAPKPAPRKGGNVVGKGGKSRGVFTAIKKVLVEDPNMTAIDIYNKLAAQGIITTPGTCGGVAADFRHSLTVLKEAGKLQGIDL